MVPSCAPDWEYGELVTEAYGKFSLGLISAGFGAAGLIISIFLWKDIPGTARIFGSFSRSLEGIGGVVSLFSGIGLLQEVGLGLKSIKSLRSIHSELFLLISILSVLGVVLALVSYAATTTICFPGHC